MKTIRFDFLKSLYSSILLVIIGMHSIVAQAATVDLFLKIDGIQGESVDSKHKDWIDIGSFSWGVTSTGGKAAFSPLSWAQQIDKSVVSMFTGLTSGQIYKSATLDVQSIGMYPTVFFQMQFNNVFLSKLNISGSDSAQSVTAALDGYDAITMTYRQQLKDGSYGSAITGGWNIAGSTVTFFGSPLVLEGLALAQPAAVPVPAAAWLLGSGLVGLIGVARRRAA